MSKRLVIFLSTLLVITTLHAANEPDPEYKIKYGSGETFEFVSTNSTINFKFSGRKVDKKLDAAVYKSTLANFRSISDSAQRLPIEASFCSKTALVFDKKFSNDEWLICMDPKPDLDTKLGDLWVDTRKKVIGK